MNHTEVNKNNPEGQGGDGADRSEYCPPWYHSAGRDPARVQVSEVSGKSGPVPRVGCHTGFGLSSAPRRSLYCARMTKVVVPRC